MTLSVSIADDFVKRRWEEVRHCISRPVIDLVTLSKSPGSLCLLGFICKMGIIIFVLPHLRRILKDQSKKRGKKSIRGIDPKDGQKIEVAVIK